VGRPLPVIVERIKANEEQIRSGRSNWSWGVWAVGGDLPLKFPHLGPQGGGGRGGRIDRFEGLRAEEHAGERLGEIRLGKLPRADGALNEGWDDK